MALKLENNLGNKFNLTHSINAGEISLTSKDLASTKLVDSIAELKLISGSIADKLEVLGYYEKGDGGGGTFYWDATSTEADNGGTIIQATGITTGRWKRVFSGAINVKWFGAKGDGAADNTLVIQNAYNYSKRIHIPKGNFKILTPVFIDSGAYITGDSNLGGFGSTSQTKITVSTYGFVAASGTVQYIGMTIKGIDFFGGETQIDCGLSHVVNIESCSFTNYTKAGLSVVKGEKNKLDKLYFWNNSVNSLYNLALGTYLASYHFDGTLYAGQVPSEFFKSDGAWFDRADLSNIVFQSGANCTWTDSAIKSATLSGSTLTNIVFHGTSNNVGKLIDVSYKLQSCTILNVTIDAVNADNTTPNIAFNVGSYHVNCSWINVTPVFAGNSNYSTMYKTAGICSNVTFNNCSSSGDNLTRFGFWFSNAQNQSVFLYNCNGAIYSDSIAQQIKQQIQTSNCNFTASNLGFGNNTGTVKDSDYDFSLLNGTSTSPTVSSFKWVLSWGSSVARWVSRIDLNGFWLSGGKSINFENIYGSSLPQKILSGNVTPEGNITAMCGSLYLYYNSGVSGKLYVKESGTGNTGWVEK